MPPPVTTPVQLTDRAGVQQVLGRCGVDIRLDADRTTVISSAELETLTFCMNYGSELTFAYCGTRYPIIELQKSWLVYWWASICSAYLLTMYRCGAVPASLQSEYEATLALIGQVSTGKFKPASMNSSSGSGTAVINVRYDPRYRTKVMREEQSISDSWQQVKSPRRIDIAGTLIDPLQRDS